MLNLKTTGINKASVVGLCGIALGAIATIISGWADKRSLESYIDDCVDERFNRFKEEEDNDDD